MLFRNAHSIYDWRNTMPTSAPDVAGAATFRRVGFSYIDANGTKDSFSIISTPARATPAGVEAAKDALAAATNANIYEVRIEDVWAAGSASPLLALENPRESAKDVIETLMKQPSSQKTQYVYIPAPLDELFVPDTNIPDVDDPLYDAVDLAFDLILPADYVPISVRFAEHKLTADKVQR